MSFSEWREVELEEVIELVIDYRGKTPKKLGGDWSQVGYRALSAKNIKTGRIVQEDAIRYLDSNLYTKWMKEEVNRGDILMTSEAPFGELLYWDSDEKIVLSQRLFCLRTNKKVDSKYLYYYMTTNRFQKELDARATGTTVRGLRQPQLLKCKIEYPPIKDQEAIANILSTLDDKIQVNNQINKTLENMAQAYFDDMFPNVAAGDTTIGEYITPKRGKNLLSKDAISGEVPVIAGGLSPATYHNVSNTQSPVITISASGANAGFVNLWTVPVWSSDSSFIDYGMTKDVYFWYVMLKKRQKEIYDSQTGSAQPHIYPKHITIMPTIKLNVDEINLYTKRVTPLFKKIANNLYEISKLQLIRDTLLPKLMSGKIRVPLDSEGDVS